MKFSVLMSVYERDCPEHLRMAMESIIHQTLPPDEIVLVKDGPLPYELESVIENYISCLHGILRVIPLSTNMGLGDALRLGLLNCSYDIVARMDSDDVSVSDRFNQQMNFLMANPSIDLIGGWIDEFTDDCENVLAVKKVPLEPEEIYQYGKFRCPVNHVSVMFRKQAIFEVGNYRKWHFNEDYDLWGRMLVKGCQFCNLPVVLVHVRVDKSTFQRRGGRNYFASEFALQREFLKCGYINFPIFLFNSFARVFVQVLCPNCLRRYLYSVAFRNSAESV